MRVISAPIGAPEQEKIHQRFHRSIVRVFNPRFFNESGLDIYTWVGAAEPGQVGTTEVLVSLARSFGLLTIAVFFYAEGLRWSVGPAWLRGIAAGLFFGAGAVISMLQVQLTPGILIDLRFTLLALAGPFGGYEAALIAAIVASACPLWLGGVGAVPDVVGIILAAGIGCLFKALVRVPAERFTLGQLMGLGLVTSLSTINCLLLPPELERLFVTTTLGPLIAATALGVVMFGAFLARECRRRKGELALRLAATTDSLTDLANRRAFLEHLARAVKTAVAEREPLSLLILDADHFKEVNDLHGHDVGDLALSMLGRAIKDQVRADGLAARIGGEEFGVILPRTRLPEAVAMAEQIRRGVEGIDVAAPACGVNLTISIGVAQLSRAVRSPGDIMKAADQALYQAKANGRNQVAAKIEDWAVAA
jgi:diguanylate cyclase (GGDEF)-like protein